MPDRNCAYSYRLKTSNSNNNTTHSVLLNILGNKGWERVFWDVYIYIFNYLYTSHNKVAHRNTIKRNRKTCKFFFI